MNPRARAAPRQPADPGPITELLTDIDEFLRSPGIPDRLACFLARRGSPRPAFDAATLIDEISFTAHRLRQTRDATQQQNPQAPPQ